MRGNQLSMTPVEKLQRGFGSKKSLTESLTSFYSLIGADVHVR